MIEKVPDRDFIGKCVDGEILIACDGNISIKGEAGTAPCPHL